MVVLMLITLFTVSWSGLKVYAIEEGKGPLAGNYPDVSLIGIAYADGDERDDDDRYENREYGEKHEEEDGEGAEEEFWEELHEGSANFMLLLIVLHILGVITAGVIHKENLVKAMITGYKQEQGPNE